MGQGRFFNSREVKLLACIGVKRWSHSLFVSTHLTKLVMWCGAARLLLIPVHTISASRLRCTFKTLAQSTPQTNTRPRRLAADN